MDTVELQYLLDHGRWLKPLHGEVRPNDRLPSQKPSHVKAYIVNTHNADQPGEHWVALFFKDKEAVYFDSYGLPPLTEDILSFLEFNSVRWTYNHVPVQGQEPLCGVYCIYVLTYLARGCNMQQILPKEDQTDTVINDLAVKEWFRQHYGHLYKQTQILSRPEHYQQCGNDHTYCRHLMQLWFLT